MQQKIKLISQKLNIAEERVLGALRLLEDGATIPFIARYRKEATGGLDEVEIAAIYAENEKIDELIKRKAFLMEAIEAAGALTDELRARIEASWEVNEIEDIYFAVKAEQLDYIRTKWLHTTQIELDEESQEEYRAKYPSLHDCVFFSIECRENNELYNRFASYSDSVVLVEPEYMRKRLQKKLASAAANYDMD